MQRGNLAGPVVSAMSSDTPPPVSAGTLPLYTLSCAEVRWHVTGISSMRPSPCARVYSRG